MAETIKLSVTQETIDANNAVIDSKAYDISKSTTETTRGTIIIADAASDQALNLGGVASATYTRLNTDQTITIKLNGSSDAITVTDQFILVGTVTAVTVSNASGSDANLEFDFRS